VKTALPVLLCVFAGICNIPYLWGFKKAYSANPFIYGGLFNLLVGAILLILALFYGRIESNWVSAHKAPVAAAAFGIALINIVAYFVINRYGASWTMITSLSAMLIPPLVVGVVLFGEKLNLWIVPAIACGILTVVFFALSKR
jgi:drug/metabolite transporter (DMT)-like permease